MKSYTDIEQSKKLAEFLPLETADMMYHSVEDEYGSGAFVATSKIITNGLKNDDFHIDDIPCWSLAALLGVLPNENILVKTTDGEYYCLAEYVITKHYDNSVDAYVAMIERLHELNLL
jgi:hypothetical protein